MPDHNYTADDRHEVETTSTPTKPFAASLVRSKQRLTASTERVVTGTARLEKYLVPEDRTITVRVYREEIRLAHHAPPENARPDRKPRNDTVVLWAEQPVITTTWVPVETARLQVTVVTTEETLTDTVNVEHITPEIGTDLPGPDDVSR